jgi:hypothetical protein
MVGMIVAAVCLVSAPAALAAGTSIKSARDEIADMRSKLSDAITQLVNLGGQLIDLTDELESALASIETSQSAPAKIDIEDAITIKDEVIPVFLDMLIGSDGILLDFEEEKQSLKGIILALINNKKIKQVNGNRILRNLNTINLLLQSVLNELDEVDALIEDGDEGEDILAQIPCDEVPDDDEDDCDDINDWLGAAIEHLDNDEFVEAEEAVQRALNLCEQALQIVDRILKKKISYILKSLDAADNVLKIEQYKKLAGKKDEIFSTPISSMSERNTRVQVFDMRGRLVLERFGDEAALALKSLANGVYLRVVTHEGQPSRIEKLLLQR